MMSKIHSAISIWREKGILSLVQEAAYWAYEQLSDQYYQQRGFQKLTIDGITAEFDTVNKEAMKTVRWMYKLEKEEVSRVLSELRTNDVFFDIGANVGIYTAFAANKIRDGNVISFEPYPPNLRILEKNAKRNGDNIEICETALSNDQGKIRFQQDDKKVGSQVGAIAPQGKQTTREVETTSVDRLISTGCVPIPNVVKIDVEGAEPLVLEGMTKTLEEDACRTVFCEIHPPTNNSRPSIQDFDSSAEDLLNLLESKGFTVSILDLNRGEDLIIGKKKMN